MLELVLTSIHLMFVKNALWNLYERNHVRDGAYSVYVV